MMKVGKKQTQGNILWKETHREIYYERKLKHMLVVPTSRREEESEFYLTIQHFTLNLPWRCIDVLPFMCLGISKTLSFLSYLDKHCIYKMSYSIKIGIFSVFESWMARWDDFPTFWSFIIFRVHMCFCFIISWSLFNSPFTTLRFMYFFCSLSDYVFKFPLFISHVLVWIFFPNFLPHSLGTYH